MRRVLPISVVLGLSLGGLVAAVVTPNGAEFQVNTHATGYQNRPAIGMNAAGEFVVAWQSDSQDGSGTGILGQMFDSGGGPVGGEFQVNGSTTDYQVFPAVGMNAAGDFVVAWVSYSQDGSGVGVFGQIFDSGGSPVGEEFQVNTYTTGHQADPAVAMSDAGDFVVAWESPQDGSGSGVFGQMFDSGGSPVGEEFRVNTYTTHDQARPAVGMNATGDFVVAWETYGQDGHSVGIFGRMFDSGGSPVGSEFQVNTYGTYSQNGPAVGMNAAGDFVVAWVSYSQDGSGVGVFGQMFDSGGSPAGEEFQVNTYTTGHQTDPVVAMRTAGDFVVAWESPHDGSGSGVFGQMFDSGGSPVGAELRVNTYTTDDQDRPAVGMNAAGDFVVAWESFGQDGSGDGAFARRFVYRSFAITAPLSGVDCSDPRFSRPTIEWDADSYDVFRVYMGSSTGFEKGTCVTSGDKAIRSASWAPSAKKWKRACNKAVTQAADPNSPVMYIAVLGTDKDLSKTDPARKQLTPVVALPVTP